MEYLDLVPLAYIGIGLAVFVFIVMVLSIMFRVVVPTNAVNIVQSSGKTVSYGKDQTAGNAYYAWPSWIPIIGVKTIQLPMSVFDQTLEAYAAYDKGRVPFVIDIMGFFRVADSNVAAQRVHSFEELMDQLKSILQGAVRSILASSEIESILEGRAEFGDKFTKEVDHQLVEWGIQSVKTIELMDIRDAEGSKVISNIMAKNKSKIEMESRTVVAENMQKAQVAEIDAARTVAIQQQEAEQQVGVRTAEKVKQVGISNQQAQQEIKTQEAVTAQKDMAITQVELVRKAEIDREVQVVAAEQDKKTAVIRADGTKQQTVIVAQGNLEATKLHAEGIKADGEAKATAERLMQLAPVEAQITLAKEIGSNQGYQNYLVTIRAVEASQAVGIEQAKALVEADVKIISNAGSPVKGADTVMELFTPQGGLQLGAMIETFKSTPAGKAVTEALSKNGQAGIPKVS